MNNMKKPLSIYIHIPFCVQKCAYCDFLSAPATSEVQEQYLHKLIEEIKEKSLQYRDYKVKTVFIGGGTPTSVSAELLCEVLGTLKNQFDVEQDAEISMECNPGTASKENLIRYREAGVNRLSIGLQSTQDALLKKLGRIHNYEQFLDTYMWAREAGFDNINIDLMSALPNQTLEDYKETLQKVLGLKPEHISAYSLIIEEGTPFFDMELELPDEDVEREMYALTERILKEYGYSRYEISNYALPEFECEHNKVYWQRGEYLGLGLGSASLIKRATETDEDFQEIRTKNNSDLSTYLKGDFDYEEEITLAKRDAMEEFFFLGLRMMKGVSFSDFEKQFGKENLSLFQAPIRQNVQDGLLVCNDDGIALTSKGIDVSNYVFQKFLE